MPNLMLSWPERNWMKGKSIKCHHVDSSTLALLYRYMSVIFFGVQRRIKNVRDEKDC